tara:strand:+ start:172 stop:756 length:585 start_codon:yes stop_codon:yes gene_type:complete
LPLKIIWDDFERPEWDALFINSERSALEQSWVFGEAARSYYRTAVRRAAIHSEKNPIGLIPIIEKPFLGLAKVIRLVRGPLWIGEANTEDQRIAAMKAISSTFSMRNRDFLFWTPEVPNNVESGRLMRSIGKRQMVTGLSTSWLDLTLSDDSLRKNLSGSWRNALRAGEKENLQFDIRDDKKGIESHLKGYSVF